MPPYTIIPHTADIALTITAPSFAELIQESIVGMFSLMKPNLQHHATKVSRHITLHSVDPAALIVTILCEALYLGLTHHEAYDTILITHLSTTDITAHLIGHQIASWEGLDIKAVTYHDLELSAHDNRYEITITFDI